MTSEPAQHWVRRVGRAIADFATDPVPRGWRRLWPWMLGAVAVVLVYHSVLFRSSMAGGGGSVNLYHTAQGWTTQYIPGAPHEQFDIWISAKFGRLGAWSSEARIELPGRSQHRWSQGLPDEVRAIAAQEVQQVAARLPIAPGIATALRNATDLQVEWTHPLYWVMTPLMYLARWVLLAGFAIALLRQRERRSWDRLQRRFLSGQCPWCGYSLDGLSLTYCPECGGQPRPAISSKRSRVRHL